MAIQLPQTFGFQRARLQLGVVLDNRHRQERVEVPLASRWTLGQWNFERPGVEVELDSIGPKLDVERLSKASLAHPGSQQVVKASLLGSLEKTPQPEPISVFPERKAALLPVVLLANRRDVLDLRRAALGKWPYVVIFELLGGRNGMAVNEAVEALTIKDRLLLLLADLTPVCQLSSSGDSLAAPGVPPSLPHRAAAERDRRRGGRIRVLPAFKIGKHWRYRRADREEWIVRRRGAA